MDNYLADRQQGMTRRVHPRGERGRSVLPVTLMMVLLGVAVSACGQGAGKVAQDRDLVIVKSEITSTATFYPYRSGKTPMEVLVVRAPDGTVRTALNTCQICWGSGRGYYLQQGNVFVCQNCGNRFRLEQIELIRGGCNPVPISRGQKIETSETITIPAAVLAQEALLFSRWGKR